MMSTMPMGIIHHDEPTAFDRLNRRQYAAAFARLASSCETPLVVGLYGGWGVGKTSLMNLIRKGLDDRTTRSVWFDAWQHQFDDSPALAMLHATVDQLGLRGQAKKLLTVIATALGSAALKATTGMTVEDIDKVGRRYEEEQFEIREARVRLQEYFRRVLEEAQGGDKCRIVFFIDDLDRCGPGQVLSVLETLKLYLNVPNCVYFLGVDRAALERSVRFHYKDQDISEVSYLDKIVQLPFTIPPIAPDAMQGFVSSLLADALRPCAAMLVSGLGDNPRQAKRFVNTLLLNHELALGARIEGYDVRLLALLLLVQYRNPELYRRICRQPSLLQQFIGNTEVTRKLHREHFPQDENLSAALQTAELYDDTPLTEYVHLTQVSSNETTSSVVVGRTIDDIVALHGAWLASNGRDGRRADSAQEDFRGIRIPGADLSESRFTTADFTGAELSGVNFTNAVLTGSKLGTARLIETNLTGAELSDAQLAQASLVRARLPNAKLQRADLSGAHLRDADLSGADLRGAVLGATDFRDVVLRGTDLRGVDLSQVRHLVHQQITDARTNRDTKLPHSIG
jgi:uncharacterized protein YjbI with pentapeptide repeats